MKTTVFFSLIAFLLISCESNEAFFINSSLNSYYNQNRKAYQEFSIKADEGGTIVGDKGMEITFGPNAFLDPQGNLVSGDVDIKLLEFLSLADMMRANVQTVNYDRQLLISAGSYYLEVSQNSEQLSLIPNAYSRARIPNDLYSGPLSTSMIVFNEFENTEDEVEFLWEPDPAAERVVIDTTIDTSWSVPFYYSIEPISLGWLNCDAFYNYPSSDRTQFSVGFNNLTGLVDIFFFVDNYPSLVKITSFDGSMYTTYFNSIPKGITGSLVAVSAEDRKYKFGSLDIKVDGDDVFTIDLEEGNKQEFEDLLNSIE